MGEKVWRKYAQNWEKLLKQWFACQQLFICSIFFVYENHNYVAALRKVTAQKPNWKIKIIKIIKELIDFIDFIKNLRIFWTVFVFNVLKIIEKITLGEFVTKPKFEIIYFSCQFYLKFTDPYLSEWSEWDTCTLTCGGGTQTHNRTCIGEIPGVTSCNGMENEDNFEVRSCNEDPCITGK